MKHTKVSTINKVSYVLLVLFRFWVPYLQQSLVKCWQSELVPHHCWFLRKLQIASWWWGVPPLCHMCSSEDCRLLHVVSASLQLCKDQLIICTSSCLKLWSCLGIVCTCQWVKCRCRVSHLIRWSKTHQTFLSLRLATAPRHSYFGHNWQAAGCGEWLRHVHQPIQTWTKHHIRCI